VSSYYVCIHRLCIHREAGLLHAQLTHKHQVDPMPPHLQTAADHAIDSIATAPTDAHHLDTGITTCRAASDLVSGTSSSDCQ
jgi:hypothetical protein